MNYSPNTYKVVITFEADDLPELYDHLEVMAERDKTVLDYEVKE